MMQVKSLIPEWQEREFHGTCNFPNSVAAFLHVYDGKEHTHGGQQLKLQEIFLTL